MRKVPPFLYSAFALFLAVAAGGQVRAEGGDHQKGTQAHPQAQTPLVKGFVCKAKDERTRGMILNESEKFAAKAFLAVAVVSKKYEAIRESPHLKNFIIATDTSGTVLRKFLNSYDQSSANSKVIAPPFAILGGFLLWNLDHFTESRRLESWNVGKFRLKGWATLGTVVLSSLGLSASRAVGPSLLPYLAGERNLAEHQILQESLEKNLAEPATFLGDFLDWDATTRGKFSKALTKEVNRTLKKTVETFREKEYGIARVSHEIVVNLSEINFVDLLDREGLATVEQIWALREFQTLQDLAGRIQTTELTPTQVRERLRHPEQSVEERISAFLRFHQLLLDTEGSLPDGELRRALGRVVEQTGVAAETLGMLCELGS